MSQFLSMFFTVLGIGTIFATITGLWIAATFWVTSKVDDKYGSYSPGAMAITVASVLLYGSLVIATLAAIEQITG